MYIHKQKLQHVSSPEKPDAVYARKLQEVIGGQYGEITVAMQYSFQAWNAHIPGKYRDLLFSTAAEEFGHVEMLATMVAQLLEKAPVGITTDAIQDDPAVAAVIGGTDLQQAIVAGAGARPVDSMGNPWTAAYVTASGNLLADMTANLNAEMQGRTQVARLYQQGRPVQRIALPRRSDQDCLAEELRRLDPDEVFGAVLHEGLPLADLSAVQASER